MGLVSLTHFAGLEAACVTCLKKASGTLGSGPLLLASPGVWSGTAGPPDHMVPLASGRRKWHGEAYGGRAV